MEKIGVSSTQPYRYERITTRGLIKDLVSFHGGPTPGESFPEFDLMTTDGKRVRHDDFVGLRPVLITTGSLTCPMTASAASSLKRLHEEFADQVIFLTVYVREAHPGELIGQARDRDEKLNYAHILQQRDRLFWTVAADSLEGDLHRQLGGRPSVAYLVDRDGNVAFRSLWAGDEAGLRGALRGLTEGRLLQRRESRARLLPVLGGIGCMKRTLADAGPEAGRQLLRKAPPLYILGGVADVFKPLPPAGRGLAALAVVALAAVALAKAARAASRDR